MYLCREFLLADISNSMSDLLKLDLSRFLRNFLNKLTFELIKLSKFVFSCSNDANDMAMVT